MRTNTLDGRANANPRSALEKMMLVIGPAMEIFKISLTAMD